VHQHVVGISYGRVVGRSLFGFLVRHRELPCWRVEAVLHDVVLFVNERLDAMPARPTRLVCAPEDEKQ
jgi:hypothetical protein